MTEDKQYGEHDDEGNIGIQWEEVGELASELAGNRQLSDDPEYSREEKSGSNGKTVKESVKIRAFSQSEPFIFSVPTSCSAFSKSA